MQNALINSVDSFEGEITTDLNGELVIKMVDGSYYEFSIVGTTRFFVSKTDPRITYRFNTEGNDVRFEEWRDSIMKKRGVLDDAA